jgi:hypothetical protein
MVQLVMKSQTTKKRMKMQGMVLFPYLFSVTTEMKMEFVEKVKKMSNEALTQMVAHIQGLLPQSITDLENEKLQIKVDDFDKETFSKVTNFIDELLINDQPSKRQKT